MKKFLKIFKNCPLFNGIDDEDILKVLDCLGAVVDTYDKRYTIMAEGSPAKYVGILLSGSAQIERVDYYGNRSIVLSIEPADLFGEAFAVAEVGAVPVTIVANELSEVMLIDCERILNTCQNNCSFHKKLIFNLMQDLANKSIGFHQKLEITSKRSTREKLLAYLNIQAQRAGSNSFVIPFDRQELADFLAVDRSGLSAEISKLRNEGVIESHRQSFKLL